MRSDETGYRDRDGNPVRLSRREVLAGVGTVSAVGVGGCIGGEDTEEQEGQTLGSSPLGRDLTDWPVMGTDPFEASETLVVLDDPSCPRCAAFHDEVVPEIEANLLGENGGSFVTRPYPVVYDWGSDAANALEASFVEGGDDAFWGLLGHYFENQPSIGTGNVYDEAEGWLAENTDIDAEGVVSDAKDGEYQDRVQATLDAGEKAGAGGTTPVVFIFQDGELVTAESGRLSYTVIESALNL